MKTTKAIGYLNLICALLALLWAYSAISKLIDLEDFKRQLYNQTFGHQLANVFIWFLPVIEIIAAVSLCFKQSRLAGLLISLVLMILFTAYVGLIILNFFGRTPCACGGVLKELGWHAHFWFNLFYLLLAVGGIWLAVRLKNFEK